MMQRCILAATCGRIHVTTISHLVNHNLMNHEIEHLHWNHSIRLLHNFAVTQVSRNLWALNVYQKTCFLGVKSFLNVQL